MKKLTKFLRLSNLYKSGLILGILLNLISIISVAQSVPEREVLYLSGTDNSNTIAWEFFCTGGRNSGYWTKIQVPSCWEQQGFGAYNYGRDNYTYGKKFKYADEKGIYRRDFRIPEEWKDKEVHIVFEGSMTDTEVKLNEKIAGEKHQGAFYRFSYNITDKLNFDKINSLEVTVSKMSADKSVNNAERLADYWIFGGIYRPVYLVAYPKEYISHTAIVAKADGSFSMDVVVKNLTGQREIYAEIVDAKNKVVAKTSINANQGDSLVNLKCKLTNPLLWTSETPNMYKVNIFLKSAQNVLYKTTDKFGFRTIEVRKGDGIYVNGTKIKVKGINRHCFWPETGRTLNTEISLMDAKLIKEMNMNAVRCSHYPPDVEFLDICDSLGLYVLDELAGWQKWYDTKPGEKLVREMVLRDVNHPSIIFWCNGNEGGTNKELDDDFLLYDPSKRPVIHPHHRPGNSFSDIDCNHYENYASSQKILNDTLIYMPTEFLHCQDDGGGGAGLFDFWELMYKSPKSGGGLLWAFLDEAVVRTDFNDILDANRVNAADGVVGPHREKEASFYAIKEILTPVKIEMRELPATFTGAITIENRYFFTNLNKCTFRWKLVKYRNPTDSLSGYQIIKEDYASAPSVLPGKTADLNIKLPADWQKADALLLNVYDPFQNEILTRSWKITKNEQISNRFVDLKTALEVTMTENDSIIILEANDISVTFSKKDGKLANIKTETPMQLSFKNGPVLCSGSAQVTDLKHFKETDGYVIEVKYSGDMQYTRWKMYGSGWLSLEYSYSLQGQYPFAGISFDYPEAHVVGAQWLGNGPYRTWKNRPHGITYNVWESLYNNTQTGSYPWAYPEFKGYYSDISWMEINTVEGKFLVASKDENLFVRLFEFYAMPGPVSYPKLPVGNISFLDCIPPIGTKMSVRIDGNASILGPSSTMSEMKGTTKRTLFFYFGSQNID